MTNISRRSLLSLAPIALGAARTIPLAWADETEVAYEDKLFDSTCIHQVDIRMDEADWEDLKANALEKTKYHADVTIDGETFADVSLSTKGSASLRGTTENVQTQRYSLKVRFDKYVEGQTYHGLDALDLNNCYSDPSLLKDFASYALFRKMGVPAPLCSYAWISVNGQRHGLYLAVEEVRRGFLARNFGGEGKLYKPEAAELTAINYEDAEAIKVALETGTQATSIGRDEVLSRLGEYTTGADLRYTGDDPADYCDIFDNNVTEADDGDRQRVISALEALARGAVEEALDADEVLRYFVVHTFTCNYDGYLTLLCHNYVLRENNGALSMLPWDYNYYSCLSTEDWIASHPCLFHTSHEVSIDDPLLGTSLDSRPMWAWIVTNEGYLGRYHALYSDFLAECLESGWLDGEIRRIDAMIRPDAQADPSALYTVEDHDVCVADVLTFCELRAQSVREQLNLAK